MKLNRNESILISLFSLGLLFLYQHYWKTPKLIELDVIQKKSMVESGLLTKNEASVASLSNRGPASNSLEKYFKSNDRFSSIVTSIVSGSKSNLFSLTRISSEGQSKVNGYTQTLYNLEAEASFISIGKFLESLEDSSLLTEVQTIDILRLENEMKRCKVSIKLYSYVWGGGK